MRLAPSLALILSLFAAPAFADDEPSQSGTGKAAVAKEPPPAEKPSDSASNRTGKIAYVGVDSGLLLIFPARGFEAGYLGLGPDLVFGVNYLSASIDAGDVGSLSASLLGAKVMWYPGNSFYLSGGLGQRKYNFDFSVASPVASQPDLKVSAASSSIGASFGIGNRWQWSGFWLGVEWLGYFVPFSSSGEVKVPTGTAAKDKKEVEAEFDKLVNGGVPLFLRLALGWAF